MKRGERGELQKIVPICQVLLPATPAFSNQRRCWVLITAKWSSPSSLISGGDSLRGVQNWEMVEGEGVKRISLVLTGGLTCGRSFIASLLTAHFEVICSWPADKKV